MKEHMDELKRWKTEKVCDYMADEYDKWNRKDERKSLAYWYKADEVDDRVKKLNIDITEGAGDSSLQLWYCEQFISEILQH